MTHLSSQSTRCVVSSFYVLEETWSEGGCVKSTLNNEEDDNDDDSVNALWVKGYSALF